MPYQHTWETIVEPEQPILLQDLEVIVAEGEPLTIGKHRPALYDEVLQYWDKAQVRQVLARATDLGNALAQQDEKTIARMTSQIGGVAQKIRCSRAILKQNKLYLALNSTNYMDFIGTNEQAIVNPDFRERLMHAGVEDYADPNLYFANPLAVCAVVYGFDTKQRDNESMYIAIALRSSKVMIYPNVHHVIGGVLDADRERKKINIGNHLRLELREEIGLTNEEMGSAQFFGIIRQTCSRIPEVICGIPIYVSQSELEQRWREHAPGKFENKNLSFYRFSQLELFLEQYAPTMVPSGAAALHSLLKYRNELQATDALLQRVEPTGPHDV